MSEYEHETDAVADAAEAEAAAERKAQEEREAQAVAATTAALKVMIADGREVEALALAKHWEGLEEWALNTIEAKRIEAKRKAAFKNPAMQPEVERSEVAKPEVTQPLAEGVTIQKRKLAGEAKAPPDLELKAEKAKPGRDLTKVTQLLPADLKQVAVSPTVLIDDLPAVVAETVPDTMLGRQVAKLVQVMNAKHVIIGSVGGKYRILEWSPSEFDPSVLVPSFQTKDDFKNRYSDLVATDNGLRKQGELWLGHRGHAKYDQITFRPGEPDCLVNQVGNVTTTMLNTWQGFAVGPAPGDWSRMQWHLDHILAGGDPKVAKYTLDWTAAGFQRPGKKRRVAIVFVGDEGVGKGVFGHALVRMYGRHGLYITQPSHLTGKFNNHLWNVCFLFADEAFWAGDREGENILKSLITDDRLMVEPKGVNSFQVKNWIDFIMASNNSWVVPVQKHGRRFAVFEVDPRFGKDYCDEAVREAYFNALWDEMARGGLAAMMYDLLRRDLTGWNPENFPVTDALRKQKQQTLRGFDKAFEGWLQVGVLPRDGGWDGRPDCATTDAMLGYVRHLRGSEYETTDALKDYLRKWCFLDGKQLIHTKWRVPGGGPHGAKFPALADCRTAFAREFGHGEWPWDDSVTGWGGV